MIRRETLRQLLILTGLGLSSITDGFIFGQMSGMIDGLQKDNTTILLNDSDISWIASTINVTCFCGFALVSIITEIFGRRKAISMMTTPVIICWLMVYFGQDKITLLLSRVIVGVSYGGILMLIHISVGEYTPPHIRGLCLNVISCIGSLTGTLLGHVLSILLHWRLVALIGLIPTTVSALMPWFWEESPSWLASKGRFSESERAYKALHPSNETSDRELNLLLNIEKKKYRESQNVSSKFSYLRKIILFCKQKYFWKVTSVGIAANVFKVASGRVLFGTFAITMLQNITSSSDILFFTFFVDGFAVIGAFISCFLLFKLKSRRLLFSSGILSNMIILSLGIFLYFWPENNSWIAWTKMTLLALYFIVLNAGPYPVAETLLTEIFPLDIKTFCLLTLAIVAGIIQFIYVKLAPNMFVTIGYHGVFFINASISLVSLLYLYIFLPETKCKTLQEIEIDFRGNDSVKDNFELADTKSKLLVDNGYL